MAWKKYQLTRKISQHILRDIAEEGFPGSVMTWWTAKHPGILSEIEEVIDEENESARAEALREAYVIIRNDANIDSNDVNVRRALSCLQILEAETREEVDYENPSREDLKREFPIEEELDQ